LGKLPHFNPDNKIPDIVLEFKNLVNTADILLIATPEYAHGVPGVLKNALDWLVSDEKLPGKETVLFVCSASEGEFAMSSLFEITKTMSLNVSSEKSFSVSCIRSKFKEGKLVDQGLDESLKQLNLNL